MDGTILEWADKLKALRDRKAELEAEMKDVNAEIDNADWHLSNLMAESETQNFTHAGTTFCPLRGEGYGDMITETINANNLSAFVKEQIAENGDALPEWLDGLVSVFEKTSVGVRKAAR